MVMKHVPAAMRHASQIIAFGAFSLIGIAGAQAMQVTAEQRAACTPDAMRLCSSEIPDVGRVTACMRAHRADLSSRCQATFANVESTHGGSSVHPHIAAAPNALEQGGRHHRHHYAYNGSRHHHGYGSFGMGQGMAIAGQMMRGFAAACGNGSLPPDVCSMSSGMMGSMGSMGSMRSLAGLANYY